MTINYTDADGHGTEPVTIVNQSVQAGALSTGLNSTFSNTAIGVQYGVGGGNPNIGVIPMLFDGASTAWPLRTPAVFKTIAAVAVTAGTPVAVWTPAANKKFRALGWALSLSVAGGVILKDATTEMIRTPLMAAGIGQSSPPGMSNGILSAAANNALNIDVTATGSVSGFVFGTEE